MNLFGHKTGVDDSYRPDLKEIVVLFVDGQTVVYKYNHDETDNPVTAFDHHSVIEAYVSEDYNDQIMVPHVAVKSIRVEGGSVS